MKVLTSKQNAPKLARTGGVLAMAFLLAHFFLLFLNLFSYAHPEEIREMDSFPREIDMLVSHGEDLV